MYSIYSVTNTERVTWYWLGVAFAWVSLRRVGFILDVIDSLTFIL